MPGKVIPPYHIIDEATVEAARKAPAGFDIDRLDHRQARRLVAESVQRLDRIRQQGRPTHGGQRTRWGYRNSVVGYERALIEAIEAEAELIAAG